MSLQERQVLEPPAGAAVIQPRLPTPWVSYGIIAVSAFMLFVGDHLVQQRFPDLAGGEKPGELFRPWVQQGDWWRLFSYAFEHEGVLHLLFNMSVVWTLGTTLERSIQSWRFAVISAVTCLGAATLAMIFSSQRPMVGASGMILGWAGAMLPVSNRQGRRSLGTWLVQIALISLLPGVSASGHLGGFLFGLPCGLALRAGPRMFRILAPVLLFGAAIIAVIASHPSRLFP